MGNPELAALLRANRARRLTEARCREVAEVLMIRESDVVVAGPDSGIPDYAGMEAQLDAAMRIAWSAWRSKGYAPDGEPGAPGFTVVLHDPGGLALFLMCRSGRANASGALEILRLVGDQVESGALAVPIDVFDSASGYLLLPAHAVLTHVGVLYVDPGAYAYAIQPDGATGWALASDYRDPDDQYRPAGLCWLKMWGALANMARDATRSLAPLDDLGDLPCQRLDVRGFASTTSDEASSD